MELLKLGLGNQTASGPSKAPPEARAPSPETGASLWPRGTGPAGPAPVTTAESQIESQVERPTRQNALQALLAFSALHEQVRRRRTLASHLASAGKDLDARRLATEFEPGERFVLDEVLRLVAERAIAITGANGLAIALAENNEIVLRAAAGTIKPDVGARIDRDSAFSGACFRTAQVVRCDDTEIDPRVNPQACRHLGARSMVAVPLCGRRRVIGLLEAFSAEPYGFNDSDIRSLTLLAELILGALKPEDEDRFAESAQAASAKLESVAPAETAGEKPLSAEAASIPPGRVFEAAPSPVAVETPKIEAAPAKEHSLPGPSLAESDSQKNREKPAPAVEPSAASHRHPGRWLVIAVIIIIMFALAGAALWWKLNDFHLGSMTVHAEKSWLNTTAGSASEGATPPSIESTGPALGAGARGAAPASGNGAIPGADGTSDAALQTASSPTPQEISKFPRVTAIRHWSSSESSTVVLDLQDQVQYEAHRLTSPDRIYFDLRDTVLAPDLAATNIEIGDALLSRVRIAQPVAGMTRVVLDTRGNSNFSVSLETNPYRLVVEVRKIGANPKGAVNLFPEGAEAAKNQLAITMPPPTREDLQLRARLPKLRIVVDAGHGGWDLGTVGRRGLLEKDVVLEIAERLGKLLESRLGMGVVYTRQDDSYIPLDERAEIANQAQADLFVSVHANYSDLPSARGVETYYTNFFSAPSPHDLELRSHSGDPNPARTGLSAADLHERIEQSRRLAASVQRSLYGTLSVENPGLRDRGIKEAGFVVLTETAMPGILAEVSFVSSPSDEQRLRSDGYREEIAEALYKGIARYAANSRVVKVASAQ